MQLESIMTWSSHKIHWEIRNRTRETCLLSFPIDPCTPFERVVGECWRHLYVGVWVGPGGQSYPVVPKPSVWWIGLYLWAMGLCRRPEDLSELISPSTMDCRLLAWPGEETKPILAPQGVIYLCSEPNHIPLSLRKACNLIIMHGSPLDWDRPQLLQCF